MPFLGVGLHILVAIFFAIHAIRTGRQLYWLFILFSFPLLGSLVYFLVEYLPSSRLEHGLRKVGSNAVRSLDPGRELREARQAFELTPTAQNQMRLADALLGAGLTAEAVVQFDQCLSGPFSKDQHIRIEAARAKLMNKEPSKALTLLLNLREENRKYQEEDVCILLGQAYAATGDQHNAKIEFAHVASQFGSIDARVAYAVWAAGNGELATAEQIKQELDKDWQHWPKYAKQINRPLMKKVNDAVAVAKR